MRSTVAALACLLALGDAPALAQSVREASCARATELEGVVAALEARIRILESQPPTPECALAPAAASSRPWEDPRCWGRLRRGMTRFEVLRLLGDPGKASVYDGFERWEYPAALGARVNFDDRGEVASWSPRRQRLAAPAAK